MSRSPQLDPSLVAGPRAPGATCRPVTGEQRVLLLDGDLPEMLDLTAGNIRSWENGPPITIPCESTPFRLGDFQLIQVQLFRDLRSSSTDQCLFTLALGTNSIEVTERSAGVLAVTGPSKSEDVPVGLSPAIVVAIRPLLENDRITVEVVARNAEGNDSCTIIERALPDDLALLTIGGPSAALTGKHGRRRPSAVHVHTQRRSEASTVVKRLAARTRREASSILLRRG